MGKKKFTFQYVSIKSIQLHLEHLLPVYLHSNMFLLNRIKWKFNHHQKIFTFQYVSIKSVFKKQVGKHIVTFTFQYVSIKSLCCCQNLSFVSDLHSNMFLLNPGEGRKIARTSVYLHSNMFLLNRLFGSRQKGENKIYIPICFY